MNKWTNPTQKRQWNKVTSYELKGTNVAQPVYRSKFIWHLTMYFNTDPEVKRKIFCRAYSHWYDSVWDFEVFRQ